jgi:hypothetical protein
MAIHFPCPPLQPGLLCCAGVLQQLVRYLRRRLQVQEVCSSTAFSQTLGPLLLQPQRMLGEPQQLIDCAIDITEKLIE